MNLIIDWYFKRPKWQRKLMQAIWFVFVFATSFIWLPVAVVVWAVCSALVEIMEWWDK